MTLFERINRLLKEGNLTVADLARWFGRPDPTVRGWAKGQGIGGPPQDVLAISQALADLESRLKQRKGLPVPQMSPRDRIRHLEQLKKSSLK